jgi:NO-binding membrane sensor protein with MHYT domain
VSSYSSHTQTNPTHTFMSAFSLFPYFYYSHFFFVSRLLLGVMLSFPVLTVVKTCSTVSFSFSAFVCSSNSTATWNTKKLCNTILQASSSWLVVLAVDQKSLIGQLQVQHETNTHENKKMHMAVIIVHFTHFLALHLYSRQFPFITTEFIQFER